MEYKIGDVFEHKGHYLIVKEGSLCGDCFFSFKNYPLKMSKQKWCARPKGIYCSLNSRIDYRNAYYKEITEIEYLMLKGEKNGK